MFSKIFKYNIFNEYNREIDEAKLKFMKENAREVNEEKLNEYCFEIHCIMQRHYQNNNILIKAKNLLQYIEKVTLFREDIKNVKTSVKNKWL